MIHMLEQHPVPQNVTTFQFRLIGDMTLKQFGYLAGGAILAYISYNLPLPFFFTYPLTAIFAFGAIGFAFIPVEERPMDVWFVSFVKSIYSPTQYVWQREEMSSPKQSSPVIGMGPLTQIIDRILPIPKPRQVPSTSQPTTTTQTQSPLAPLSQGLSFLKSKSLNLNISQKPAFQSLTPVMASTPIPQKTAGQTNPPPTPEPAQQPDDSKPTLTSLEQRLKQMEEQLEKERQEKQRLATIHEQLLQTQQEKKLLEEELQKIKQNIQPSVPDKKDDIVKQAGIPVPPQQPVVSSLSSQPNVITGIVREQNGNLLVGILVTVKDKDDIPVRALKTNKLGQFASSTPLNNGTYTIEAEDPKKQFSFDLVDVTLSGQALTPLQLIAKSKQQLERQQLERALFGNKQ